MRTPGRIGPGRSTASPRAEAPRPHGLTATQSPTVELRLLSCDHRTARLRRGTVREESQTSKVLRLCPDGIRIGAHWRANEIPLNVIAAQGCERGPGVAVLDPLGGHLHVEIMRKVDGASHDGQIL